MAKSLAASYILGCIKHNIAVYPTILSTATASPWLLCIVLGSTIQEDIKVLECAQRIATKMEKGLEGMSYEEQLRILDLFSGRNLLFIGRRGE